MSSYQFSLQYMFILIAPLYDLMKLIDLLQRKMHSHPVSCIHLQGCHRPYEAMHFKDLFHHLHVICTALTMTPYWLTWTATFLTVVSASISINCYSATSFQC